MGGTGAARSETDTYLNSSWRFTGSFSSPYAGRWVSGLNNQGVYAYYWSSTAYSSTTNARGLRFYVYGDVYPGTNFDDKYLGFPVRCVVAP